MSVSPVKINTTPVFAANYKSYQENWPIICNEGGSRSGKTYSIIQLLIGIALNEPRKRISIVSHSLPHIKRGAYRDFKTIMQEIGKWREEDWRATDFVFTFKNGSYIELFGLEDEGKARGPGRDILFINEANLINKVLFDQLAMRTTGTIFMDWNPAEFTSWVYDIADSSKNKRIHSTYLDNIYNLSPQQVQYIESYKDLPDDFMWKVYGLGERGAAKTIIYTAWKKCDELPGKGDVFYGLDFGYTNPTAFVRIEHYEGCNYVEELIYDRQLTKPELFEKIKGLNIGYSPIYADAAEPDSIEEMYRMGLNVKPGVKDVWAGIVKVKSYPLFIKGKNVMAEIGSYKWKVDKNENVLEEPVKENDHAMDAMRYAIHTHLNNPPLKLMLI
jgi:phage terminase large subunit